MEPGITAPATFFSTVRVGGDCVAARRPKESQAIVPVRCMIASDRAASLFNKIRLMSSGDLQAEFGVKGLGWH